MPESKKSKKSKAKRKVTRRPTQNQSNHQTVTVKVAGAGGGRVGGGFSGGGGGGAGGAGGAGASSVVYLPSVPQMGYAPAPFHMADVNRRSALESQLRNVQSEYGGPHPPSSGASSMSAASHLTSDILSAHDYVMRGSPHSSVGDFVNGGGGDSHGRGGGAESVQMGSERSSQSLHPYQATLAARALVQSMPPRHAPIQSSHASTSLASRADSTSLINMDNTNLRRGERQQLALRNSREEGEALAKLREQVEQRTQSALRSDILAASLSSKRGKPDSRLQQGPNARPFTPAIASGSPRLALPAPSTSSSRSSHGSQISVHAQPAQHSRPSGSRGSASSSASF